VRGQREQSQRHPASYLWLERMEVDDGGSQKFVEKLKEIVRSARERFTARPAGNYRQEPSTCQLVAFDFINFVWGSPSCCFCVRCSQYGRLVEKLVGSQSPMLKEWFWLVHKGRCNRRVRHLCMLQILANSAMCRHL
jgi:hypothetical protein